MLSYDIIINLQNKPNHQILYIEYYGFKYFRLRKHVALKQRYSNIVIIELISSDLLGLKET